MILHFILVKCLKEVNWCILKSYTEKLTKDSSFVLLLNTNRIKFKKKNNNFVNTREEVVTFLAL